jgi:hypothetical protein
MANEEAHPATAGWAFLVSTLEGIKIVYVAMQSIQASSPGQSHWPSPF